MYFIDAWKTKVYLPDNGNISFWAESFEDEKRKSVPPCAWFTTGERSDTVDNTLATITCQPRSRCQLKVGEASGRREKHKVELVKSRGDKLEVQACLSCSLREHR
ncbi:hypothetical protein CBL_01706 [Carabus blaptoides fortunei]